MFVQKHFRTKMCAQTQKVIMNKQKEAVHHQQQTTAKNKSKALTFLLRIDIAFE